jgi:putative intracellular protease/amidase
MGLMPGRALDILVYPGFQPIDAIGPHEVFAGATQPA